MRPTIKREYEKYRAKGWRAAEAMRHARLYYAFWRREAGEHDKPDTTHCVRLRAVPHDASDFDDLCGDCFNPEVNRDIPRERIERERAEFLARCNREGVWGLVAEYFDEVDREWKHADSCFGFLGDDLEGNGYDDDLKKSALDARTHSVLVWRAMRKAAP
jgi:hypothetical protein